MASPALLLAWKNEEAAHIHQSAPSSAFLLESQRDAFEKEVAHAASFLNSSDEDGVPYYTKETLDRGIQFLKMHAEWIWKSCGTQIPIPTIGPGPQSSLDMYWKTSSFELLVNIPVSGEVLGTFYGRDNNQQTAKGSFDHSRFAMSVASWLMA